MNTSQTNQSPLVERARGLLAKITPEPLTFIRYEHGGARLYKEMERTLVADFYNEGDREFYRATPDLVEGLCKENEALKEAAQEAIRELSFVVHGAGRKGGSYEAALNKLRAALTQPEIETTKEK